MLLYIKIPGIKIDPGAGAGGIKVNVPLLLVLLTRKKEEVEEL